MNHHNGRLIRGKSIVMIGSWLFPHTQSKRERTYLFDERCSFRQILESAIYNSVKLDVVSSLHLQYATGGGNSTKISIHKINIES